MKYCLIKIIVTASAGYDKASKACNVKCSITSYILDLKINSISVFPLEAHTFSATFQNFKISKFQNLQIIRVSIFPLEAHTARSVPVPLVVAAPITVDWLAEGWRYGKLYAAIAGATSRHAAARTGGQEIGRRPAVGQCLSRRCIAAGQCPSRWYSKQRRAAP